MHVTVDPIVTVDGDAATQDVTLLVLPALRTSGKSLAVSSTGRYVDTLVRSADGWLFSSRRRTLDGWPKT